MSAASTPRSARFDLPPAPVYTTSSTTDSGLAEWTSRIKAMQRQVDADDEAEQRRLEEEIVRARLARTRRTRTGQSGDFGVGMHGIDLSKLQEVSPIPRTPGADDGASSSEKQLMSTISLPKPAINSTPSSGDKPAPISLAAFMGGSASGPRLKRHEPQVDVSLAHDGRAENGSVHPIFGRGGVAMPGMVGRGSAGAPPTPSAPASTPPPVFDPAPPTPRTAVSELSRSRTTSASNVARRYVEKLEEQGSTKSPSPKLSGLGIRERRISTPAGSLSGELRLNTPVILPSRPLSQNLGGRTTSPDTRVKSPTMETRPKTPTAIAEIRSKTPTASEVLPKTQAAESRPKTPVVVESRSKTPATEFRTKTPVGEPRAKTPSADTTREKTPVHPSPTRTSFPSAAAWQTPRHQLPTNLPSVSLSNNTVPPKSPAPPSPVRTTHAPQPQRGVPSAFLRLPMSSSVKDPTPSISRLQGRGFVHSVVQASDRLGGEAQGSTGTNAKHIFSSSPPVPAQGREKGTRRASVLDRWQPVVNSSSKSSTPSPPPQTLKTSTPTRSHVVNANVKPGQGQDVSVVKTHDTGRSLRSAVSLPKIPDVLPTQDILEKLGSSSTMISYIKPTKTGDDPVIPDVDELGVRKSDGGGTVTVARMTDHGAGSGVGISAVTAKTKTPRVSGSPLPSSPGKPLSHPTKDRAKKPRKARFEEAWSVPAGDAAVAAVPWSGPSTLGIEVVKPTQSPFSASVPPSGAAPSDPPAPRTPVDAPTRSQSEPAHQLRITPPSTSGRVTDRWIEPTLIGIKPPPSPSVANRPPPSPKPMGVTGMVGRRALPGFTDPAVAIAVDKDDTPTSKDRGECSVPPSPTRHIRIPSTGNRALVMEVAQAFNAQQDVTANRPPASLASGPTIEKRKSSYERYSSITMPPLKEERTPEVSPANTMSRTVGENLLGGKVVIESPMNSLRTDSGPSDQPPVSPKEPTKVHIGKL
ncbi:hypothetical protein BS17DRAFT_755785 [Gyrodon lividus]|nr:hypothetical protein BS17DRAFT_755785 [Gyrodon lividus]